MISLSGFPAIISETNIVYKPIRKVLLDLYHVKRGHQMISGNSYCKQSMCFCWKRFSTTPQKCNDKTIAKNISILNLVDYSY